LVAKLKAVFDRFDGRKDGQLTGEQVEQALLYMNRPVDSVQVNYTTVVELKVREREKEKFGMVLSLS
jgi:hypothetical protein